MKCKKGSRRDHFRIVGPSLLMKVVKEEDSFIRFAGHNDTNWLWEKRLSEYHTDALFREDPFGAQEYSLPYSLDKRKRWIVPDIIGDEIKKVQDPSRNLRVSASVHLLSRNDCMPILQRPPWGWRYGVSQVEELNTTEYHDVSRDGKVKHKHKKHAKLITLDREPKAKKRRVRPTPTVNPMVASNLPYDKEQYFQKAHVRYNIIKLVDDKRKVHLHNVPSYNHRWAYDPTVRDRERTKRELVGREWKEYNGNGCPKCECMALVVEAPWLFDDDEEEEETSDAPSELTLMDCIVEKKSPKRARKSASKPKFVDEPTKVKIDFPSPSIINDEAEEEGFVVVEVSTHRMEIHDAFEGDGVDGDCPICLESFSAETRSFSLVCGHSFCISCWSQQAQTALDLGGDEVGCMDPECSCILSTEDAKRLFAHDSLAYYLSTVQEARIRKEKARRCGQCNWPVDYSGAKVDSCSCGALLCGSCPSLFHGSLACDRAEQYNAYLKKNGMDSCLLMVSSSKIVTELVRCPSCETPLQKSAGCDHMICVCGAAFCWKCGQERDVHHDTGGGCRQKEQEMVVMMDVFTRTGALIFSRRSLAEAVRRRVELAMRKREITKELSILPLSKARLYMRKIEALSILLESSLLRREDPRVITRIEFALYRFLNRTSGSSGNQRARMLRRADEMAASCDRLAISN